MMEAETALTEGISVCAKHRLLDLVYCMQFLLMKVLFQRNPKAALKSIDTHIANCTTFKHAHWVYAFRFLKASFYLQSGVANDHHALENLRKIASIAEERGDLAIYVMSHLLEGLAHLTTMKDDAVSRIHTCLAAAGKLQLQQSTQLPQIELMRTFLDFACSMHKKSYSVSLKKLSVLQEMMAKMDSSHWGSNDELLLPVKKQANASHTISDDTRDIIRQGQADDVLVIPVLRRQEYRAIVTTFISIVQLSTQRDAKTKSLIDHGANTIISLQDATSSWP
ncbi:hypothetical protein P8C59_006896 [Phyllachora maydis]|uniref:Uncharacterized protein n=1 Tax=Phyllachora maydis TaxID=1825666 RepID=A0AAD9I8G3_9PEZI|nr:hypothetical protein P8C59_006896 [Phyllachora maydis]